MDCVPDFFQDDTATARRQQVTWLKDNLNLGDAFFVRTLSIREDAFSEWLNSQCELKMDEEIQLAELWQMFLHVLALASFDFKMAKELLSAIAEPSTGQFPSVPWAGNSIKHHLEEHRTAAIQQVTGWLTSLRFQNRTKASQEPWRAATAWPRLQHTGLSNHIAWISNQESDLPSQSREWTGSAS